MRPMFRTELPLRIRSEANERCHWSERAKRAKAHRAAAIVVPKLDYLPCVVTLTRIGPRLMDDDNLANGCKALRDGIADRLGVNDNDPRIEWRYDQLRRGWGDYAVLIEIESA